MMMTLSKIFNQGTLAIASTSIAFGCFAGAAKAATLSYSFTNPLEVTEISQTGTLFKFDSSLGTLTSAKLTLSSEFLQSFTGTNNSAQAQRATIVSGTDIFFDIPGVTLATPDSGILSFSQTTGRQVYARGQTKSFGPFREQKMTEYLFPPNSSLDFFNGSGEDFSVSCESETSLTVSGGGGNISSTQTTQASCGASIEYTYNRVEPPVGTPEPTMFLGILAVAGASAFSRRHQG
jgi:hypothetical protein